MGGMTTAMVEQLVELRRFRRYYVQAPVLFSWKNADGSLQSAEGMTRDISMQAVFVLTRKCPRRGDQVRIDIVLPSLRKTPGVRLHGDGVVLRTDLDDAGQCGFAAATSLRSDTRDSADALLGMRDCGRTQ
jgi:hypothetical protein